MGWLPPNQSHEGPDKDVLARRLSHDDNLRPLVGDVRVVVSAAENKRNCAFVQALTNDSAITTTEFDVEDSRGKISILAGASESRIFEQRHYADVSCFDSRFPATGVVKTVLLVWYGMTVP